MLLLFWAVVQGKNAASWETHCVSSYLWGAFLPANVSAQSYYHWHEKVPSRSGNVFGKRNPIRQNLTTHVIREDQKP